MRRSGHPAAPRSVSWRPSTTRRVRGYRCRTLVRDQVLQARYRVLLPRWRVVINTAVPLHRDLLAYLRRVDMHLRVAPRRPCDGSVQRLVVPCAGWAYGHRHDDYSSSPMTERQIVVQGLGPVANSTGAHASRTVYGQAGDSEGDRHHLAVLDSDVRAKPEGAEMLQGPARESDVAEPLESVARRRLWKVAEDGKTGYNR